jgi:hypothetical protein
MTQHIGQQVIQLTHIITDIMRDHQNEDTDIEIIFDGITTQLLRLQGLGLALGATIEDLVPENIFDNDFDYSSLGKGETRDAMLLTLSIAPYFLDPNHLRYIAQDLGITPQFLIADYTNQEIGEIYDVITGMDPQHDLPDYLTKVMTDYDPYTQQEAAIHPSQEDSKEIQDILRDHK